VVASILALAEAVRASAPSDQYEYFTQSSLCIQDKRTGLTWQRAPLAAGASVAALDFGTAAADCAALGAGWRVPTVNELSTLVDEVPHLELDQGNLVSKAIDANAFPDTPVTAFSYWTSSLVPGSAYAWEINFTSGSTLREATSHPNYVRCVIAGSAGGNPACN
jgi:hypothetical protein